MIDTFIIDSINGKFQYADIFVKSQDIKFYSKGYSGNLKINKIKNTNHIDCDLKIKFNRTD